MTVELLRADRDDIDEIVRIEKRCFPKDPWSKQAFEEIIYNPSYHNFTAKDEGSTAGYICGYIVADELNIADLAVDWEYRRKGIGMALLSYLLQYARNKGCTSAYLEVRASNEAAISLYRKAGFEGNSKRKNYYQNPAEDALLLHCWLEE